MRTNELIKILKQQTLLWWGAVIFVLTMLVIDITTSEWRQVWLLLLFVSLGMATRVIIDRRFK